MNKETNISSSSSASSSSFKSGSLCEALAARELARALNSWFFCLHLPSAGIIDMLSLLNARVHLLYIRVYG
ncbi:hypothetical protein ACQP3J_33585, partial [Escherichia coli]